MAKTHTVMFRFKVKAGDFLNAGRVSSEIKKYLMQLGLNHGLIRKVIICAYEAEINLVIHSVGGEIKLEITDSMIHLFSKDEGPGICDIEQAMKEGYSTASEKAREMGFGAGMGLPNMKKQADSFDIKSSRNGTSIHMTYLINS
ncbi:MAG: anti-sigma regulatory factor [Turicibacter sp.]|nr:anti-sigma regulatory factor [Turicibacter sp.]